MSTALVFLGVILALGLWGYFQRGDALYVVNKLSASEIAIYASMAGFQGNDLVTAIAIALAESGGDPQAVGDQGTSLGLWQIHYTVHQEFDKAQLFDPQYNANAAYALFSRRGNFSDWSTFTVVDANGVLPYAKFLDEAESAVTG
jgi:soluble lytic murein transglycosylase-like protein